MSGGRYLGFFMRAKPGESTKCLRVGPLGVNNVGVEERKDKQAPVPLPTGIMYSPQVSLTKRNHGRIEDCEQSTRSTK